MGPGHNGPDPEPTVQHNQVIVLQTLIYGLKLIFPEHWLVGIIERTNKKFLKYSLSLPTTMADCAVYILTGTIPIEGVAQKRGLSLFGNVCRQDKNSTKQQLTARQLNSETLQ